MNHDIAALSAETLLAIPLSIPERLFTGDPDQARREFRTLVAIWHPDRCSRPEATAVFQHLSRLYATAERKLRDGAWQTPGLPVSYTHLDVYKRQSWATAPQA